MTLPEARVHDLLRVCPDSVGADCGPELAWVNAAVLSCPWLVVRREPASPTRIAVGFRGATRDHRWGGFVAKDQVRGIVRPEELLLLFRSSKDTPRTPALKALREMDERWGDLALCWGPVGSVGFELASGRPATDERSDLDLVIYAPARISRDRARSLWDRTKGLAAPVDVRVETPQCGFSLEEYASAPSTRILLRYPTGPRLGNDPWAEPAAIAAIV